MEQTLIDKALSHLNRGNYDKARQLCEKINLKDQKNAQVSQILGVIAYNQQQYDEAERFFVAAVALDENNRQMHEQLGLVYFMQQRYELALTSFNKGLSLEPTCLSLLERTAKTYLHIGHYPQAYTLYRQLFEQNADNKFYQNGLLTAVTHLKIDTYSAEFENDLLRYLDIDDSNINQLSFLVISTLIMKYDNKLDVSVLAQDPLFIKSVRTIICQQPEFEKILILLRHKILLAFAENLTIEPSLIPAMEALAQQAFMNEYVWNSNSQEQELLGLLNTAIMDCIEKSGKAIDVAPLVLIKAMYTPIYQEEYTTKITQFALDSWPVEMHSIIQNALIDIQHEIQVAKEIPHLVAISNETSKKVQHQYEENPYPRWVHLGKPRAISPADIIRQDCINFVAPKSWKNKKLNVLIAGCGTGRHAIYAALLYKNVNVTAIDLSTRSLAYAKIKAKHYGVKNIQFMQADILDVPHLDKKFDIIESVGVLHHMKTPLDGWGALKKVLANDGVMQIGLYSETARQSVIALRDAIAQLQLSDEGTDIRLLRDLVLMGKLGDAGVSISKIPDFYSLSACRDLLFHVQEHRFLLSQIAQCLKTLELRFLSFHGMRPALKAAYEQRYPDDTQAFNLDNWADFENEQPATFTELMNLEMFSFWCQNRTEK